MLQQGPIGNQLWKLRAKHGRDRIFTTPEILWEAAMGYFEWVDSHPEYEIDFRGKDATEVLLPKKQPYVIHGLCRYLGVNTLYFSQFKQSIADRSDELSRGFSMVIRDIEDTIYNQKFSGAASGFFNANIIARDLGLAEKTDNRTEHTVQTQIDYSKISDEALKELDDASKNQPRLS